MTNEERYDLERAKKRLADTAIKIKDVDERDRVLKCVYELGKILDEQEEQEEKEEDTFGPR